MTLHDSTAYHILTAETAPSLPDPVTVAGRTHALVNMSTSSATWTSTGTNPFMVNGVAVTSLAVPAGTSAEIQSDGSKWVLRSLVGTARRIFSATAATAANGQATFTFSPAFATVPVVAATAQPGALGTNGHFCEVLSVTTTTCLVQGWQGRGVLVGGQTTDPSGAGVTIHLHAIEAGQV